MFPMFSPVRQQVSADEIYDIDAHVRAQMHLLLEAGDLQPGMRVAVGAGSRGVSCISAVLHAVISVLRTAGADPFLVPAMGSHGGGTAEGQRQVLEGYGLGANGLGIEIQSSMDAVQIGETPGGMPVFFDVNAAQADAIMVVNRIKPHTSFRAPWESGLFKMLAVGFGKRVGAATLHRWGIDRAIPEAARVILETLPVLGGVGIVENGHHRPAHIEAISAAALEAREPQLLKIAHTHLPRIPLDPLDLLVFHEMGKDISGTGMDLNVIGMWRRSGGVPSPQIERLAVLDLTENSHGNAIGMGYADLIPERLRNKVDMDATYTNCLTSANFSGARTPLTVANDYEVLRLGMPGLAPEQARVVIAQNTLALETLWVSDALLDDVEAHATLTRLGPAEPLHFDRNQRLVPMAVHASSV